MHELIYWTPTVNTLLGRVGWMFEQSVNATLLTVQDRRGKLIFKYYSSSTKLPSANHLSSRATCKHWTVPLRHLVITGRAALNIPVKFNNRGGATKYPSPSLTCIVICSAESDLLAKRYFVSWTKLHFACLLLMSLNLISILNLTAWSSWYKKLVWSLS